jgi:hypothetical protein
LSKRRIPDHGTRNRYALGCDCDPCTDANRIYQKRYRENRLTASRHDATGTARKLRALHTNGWPWEVLAARLGSSARWPAMLAAQPTPTVTTATFAAVDSLWNELRDQPGPSVRARTWARKRGWDGPDAWADETVNDPAATPYSHVPAAFVDPVAVELALKGRPVTLTPLERHHAVHAGRRQDMPYSAIASALRMSLSRAKELGARPLPEGCEVAA